MDTSSIFVLNVRLGACLLFQMNTILHFVYLYANISTYVAFPDTYIYIYIITYIYIYIYIYTLFSLWLYMYVYV